MGACQKYPNGTVVVKTIVKPGTKYVGQFAVMRKLMRVRDVLLTVNREYIKSAAQADEYPQKEV